jgi:TP53 regulating kinase-like protein
MDSTQEQQQDFGVLLKQGAEGVSQESIYLVAVSYFYLFVHSLFCLLQRVFVSTFVGRKCVIKERFSKKYRHPLLDSKLTLKRLNAVSFHN